MASQTVGLIAQILTVALIMAVIAAIWLARGRLNWKYWRLGIAVLAVYGAFFALLASSSHKAGMIDRESIAWTLRLVNLFGALFGWAWVALTAHASFRLERRSGYSLSGMAGD